MVVFSTLGVSILCATSSSPLLAWKLLYTPRSGSLFFPPAIALTEFREKNSDTDTTRCYCCLILLESPPWRNILYTLYSVPGKDLCIYKAFLPARLNAYPFCPPDLFLAWFGAYARQPLRAPSILHFSNQSHQDAFGRQSRSLHCCRIQGIDAES